MPETSKALALYYILHIHYYESVIHTVSTYILHIPVSSCAHIRQLSVSLSLSCKSHCFPPTTQLSILDSITLYWSSNWDLQLIRIQIGITWLCLVYLKQLSHFSQKAFHDIKKTNTRSYHSVLLEYFPTALPQTVSFFLNDTKAAFQNKPRVQFSKAKEVLEWLYYISFQQTSLPYFQHAFLHLQSSILPL